MSKVITLNDEILKKVKTEENALPEPIHQCSPKNTRAYLNEYLDIVKDINSDEKFNSRIENLQLFTEEFKTLFDKSTYKKSYLLQKDATEKELKIYKCKQWSADMRKFLENNCPFELSELRTIVLGSVGFEHFCTSTAFVAEDKMFRSAPNSVKYFADCLDDINYQVGFEQQATDFYAQHARVHGGFLFLNTCLSVCPNEAVASVCSVEFINQILIEAQESGHRLAVLDMRLTRYICKCELNPKLEQDRLFSDFSYDGDAYKLVNPTDRLHDSAYHRIVRLGNPAFWSGNADETKYITQSIKLLMNQGYEINCIYLAKGEYEAAKLRSTTTEVEDMDCEETESIEQISKLDLLLKKYCLETKSDQSSLNIALNFLLALASEHKMNLKKENIQNIAKYVRMHQLKQSSVCDSVYYSSKRFVIYDESENVALVFRNDLKARQIELDFNGITIVYLTRHSQFVLSQPKVLEIIHQIHAAQKQNFDATERSTLMAALVDLSSKTRPDICADVSLLESYIKKYPNNTPIDKISYLISYLARTKDLQLIIQSAGLCFYSSCSFIVPKRKDSNNNSTKMPPEKDSNNNNLNNNVQLTKIDQDRAQIGVYIEISDIPVGWMSQNCSEFNDSASLELAAANKAAQLLGQTTLLRNELLSELDQSGPSAVHCTNYFSNYNNNQTTDSVSKVERSKAKCKHFADLYDRAERVNISMRHIRVNNNPARHFVGPMRLDKGDKTNENNANIRDTIGLADPAKNYYH